MTLVEFRYYLEHKIFPEYYFEDTERFITGILSDQSKKDNDENVIYRMITNIAKKNNIVLPYLKDEYKAELFPIDKINSIIRIRLPEPEKTLLCTYIYLFLSKKNLSHNRYFTVELLKKRWRKNVYCLCEWKKEGLHRNHNYVSSNLEKIQDKIIQLCVES